MGGIVSGVSSLLGGGNNNSQFTAQQAAITNPVNQQQLQQGYNAAQTGLTDQTQLLSALQAQNGIQNQSNVFNQQQALANALQLQSQGQGPNPAQAALNQNTAANTANQAALMAGQRGANANVGLIARQAAMQGAANQQQAIGQGATLQAQQQLAAQGQLAAQQQALAGLATQQVGQQTGATGNLNQFAQGEQGQLLNAQGAANNAAIGSASQANQANSAMARQNAAASGAAISGLVGAGGSILGKATSGGSSGGSDGLTNEEMASTFYAKGGEVNPKLAKVPLKDRFADNVMKVPHLKLLADLYHPHMMNGGESVVPGKAMVKGDNIKNDKVPAMLSPKEIVLPRSITLAPDAPEKARAFVADLVKKHMKDNGGERADFHAALKKAGKK